ncbi:22676_t:CDS:2 [Entrophospora sp. SA101]|nr:22676_t:CDS:2 [Entrophospora sp. SA101]
MEDLWLVSFDHNKETIPSNTINQPQQTTLNFPLIADNTHKKHSFDEIDANNDTDGDESNEHNDNLDECSNDEYNELPLDGKPYMCPKEIKLHRHKYFSRLINPNHI